MTTETFDGVLLSGHKQDAVELPFDPATRWNVRPVALWPGRRGHRVAGSVNGAAFASCVVARSKRHFLLIGNDVREQAHAAVGDTVRVVLHPEPSP